MGGGINLQDLCALLVTDHASLVTLVFDRSPKAGGVDQLHQSFAVFWFLVRENPEVGANACAEEDFRGQGDDGFNQIVFQQPATDFGFTRPRAAVEERRSRKNNGRSAAAVGRQLHLARKVHQKQHGAIVDAWQAWAKAPLVLLFLVLKVHGIGILFPLLAKRGIAHAVVKPFTFEVVGREC